MKGTPLWLFLLLPAAIALPSTPPGCEEACALEASAATLQLAFSRFFLNSTSSCALGLVTQRPRVGDHLPMSKHGQYGAAVFGQTPCGGSKWVAKMLITTPKRLRAGHSLSSFQGYIAADADIVVADGSLEEECHRFQVIDSSTAFFPKALGYLPQDGELASLCFLTVVPGRRVGDWTETELEQLLPDTADARLGAYREIVLAGLYIADMLEGHNLATTDSNSANFLLAHTGETTTPLRFGMIDMGNTAPAEDCHVTMRAYSELWDAGADVAFWEQYDEGEVPHRWARVGCLTNLSVWSGTILIQFCWQVEAALAAAGVAQPGTTEKNTVIAACPAVASCDPSSLLAGLGRALDPNVPQRLWTTAEMRRHINAATTLCV